MNCQTFEDTVNVVARGQMMDAVERAAAFAHAAACEHCAIRLAAERALSGDLRRLAEQMEANCAPPAIERRLLIMFDAQSLTLVNSSTNRRWFYAVGAIAAVFVLAFGLGALRWRTVPSSELPVRTVASNSGVKTIADAVVPPVGPASGAQPLVPSPARPNHNRRRLPSGITNASADVSSKEVATDFIPVMYGSTGVEVEPGSQIVRVELPRSAMASFGLPVNMDRADQRVKADVLLGVDGLAHAIRFVQ
jgi:hypothetical protein